MQDLHRQFLAYLLTYPQGFAQLLSEKGACVTVMPSCCLIHAMYYVELATNVATPIRLRRTPPKGETTHYILRVAIAPSKCVRYASTGKRLTWFSGRFAPLRTKFACHPIQGGRINRSTLSCRLMWHTAERP